MFPVKCETHTVDANWPLPPGLRTSNKREEKIPMKLNQFPLVCNTATTGHKLQGKMVDSILVHDWSYSTNWPYVVLSQVTTMKGVFLRPDHPLDEDVSKYALPQELVEMLQHFKDQEPAHLDLSKYQEVAVASYDVTPTTLPNSVSP